MIRLHHLLLEGNMKTLSPDFKIKLFEITELSKKINKNDKQKILQMIKDHVFEIATPSYLNILQKYKKKIKN